MAEQELLFELPKPQIDAKRALCFKWLEGEREYQTAKFGDFQDHPQSLAGYTLIIEDLLSEVKEAWMKGYGGTALIKLGQISAVALASMEEYDTPKKYRQSEARPGAEMWRGKNLT